MWMEVPNGHKAAWMTPTTTDPTFVLLAGGKSVRMGEDKGFVSISHNSHFLSHILEKLNHLSNSIFVSLRNEQLEPYSKFIQKSALIIDKDLPIAGPLKGILSSYIYLKEHNLLNDFIYVLPIDIPYIEERTIQRLLDTFQEKLEPVSGIFYESKTGLEPLCGIYTRQALSQWLATLSIPGKHEFSLQKRIKILEPKPLFIKLPDEEEFYFRNINSKNEL